jgi:ribosome biogenesis GTPase
LNAAGTIVAAFGRHYEIELADGRLATGYPRGKKSPFAVGDEVELTPDGRITGHARATACSTAAMPIVKS